MDQTLTKEVQKQVSPQQIQQEQFDSPFKILDLQTAPETQERPFEEILKGNVVLQRDINVLTDELKDLETKIAAEYSNLNNSAAFKDIVDKSQLQRTEQLIKSGNVMATIRCHELLKDTKYAIERSLSQLSSGQIDASRWKEAQSVLLEGSRIQNDVSSELSKLSSMADNTAGVQTVDDLCSQLLRHSSAMNSSYFKNIIKAVKNFQKLPTNGKTPEATDALYNALDSYIESRSKSGTKTNFKLQKGAKRMELAKQLKDALSSTYYVTNSFFSETISESGQVIKELSMEQISENINKRVDEIASVPHPEFFETEQLALSRYKDIRDLMITGQMLEPDYVKSHAADFQKYIDIINTAKKNIESDKSNLPAFTSFYKTIRSVAATRVKYYDKLEDYVKLCNRESATPAALKAAKAKIKSWNFHPENIDTAVAYFNDTFEHQKCFDRILDVLKAPKHQLKDDYKRFSTLVRPWQINKNGEPATPNDMKIFKENLRFFATMYFGDKTEYLVAIKEVFERLTTEYFFTKNDMNRNTWEKNYHIKLTGTQWANTQHLLTAWVGTNLTKDFAQMFPELSAKVADFHNMADTLVFSHAVIFDNFIGDVNNGTAWLQDDIDDTLEESEKDSYENLYAKAKVNYEELEKKYGKVFK